MSLTVTYVLVHYKKSVDISDLIVPQWEPKQREERIETGVPDKNGTESTKAPEVAASVVQDGKVSATLEYLGLFFSSKTSTSMCGDTHWRRELKWQ